MSGLTLEGVQDLVEHLPVLGRDADLDIEMIGREACRCRRTGQSLMASGRVPKRKRVRIGK